MKRLNKKEVAKLVRLFADMTRHAEIHERKWLRLLGNDTERAIVESNWHRQAEKYWNFNLRHVDMRLAEMGILVNGKESENILDNWDHDRFRKQWREYYDAYLDAQAEWDGFKAEQESEENQKAGA